MKEITRIGMNFVGEVKDARVAMLRASDSIERAKDWLRLNPGDEMWTRILGELQVQLEESKKKEQDAINSIFELEKEVETDMDRSDYKIVINELGKTIADVSKCNHVANASDEYELHKAMNDTEQAIKDTREKISENNGDDLNSLAVLVAQLNYYTKDMKQHPWAAQRLEEMQQSNSRGAK